MKIFGLLISSSVAFFLRLTVLCKLWGYIVVPMGAHEITLTQAWGISLIISLVSTIYNENDLNRDKAIESNVFSIINSLFAWFLGWLIFT